MSSNYTAAALCLLLVAAPLAAQNGYRLRADRVEVSTRSQWQRWQFPRDAVAITASGEIAPRFFERPVDAVRDADSYAYEIPGRLRAQYANAFEDEGTIKARGGIKLAGSQPARARRIMDGQADTFWEPDPQDPLENWWVEIDLGRLVSATRVVLRFAEAQQERPADPFLQFRVHSATGLSPFGQQDQSGALDYVLVGGTTRPNRDQRLFEFDLEPLGKHSEEWQGRLMQYLRIAVTASRGERAEEVGAERYEALAAADRGAVDYVWKIAGEERLVDEERYAALPAGERGGVRYYRRERPQLAEVEVWTTGENLSLRLLERGGTLHDVNPNSFPERAFDGSMRSDWFGLVYRTTGETAEWGLLTVDLGAQFWVDALRIIARPPKVGGGENLLFGYLLRGSDGSRAPNGSLIWEELSAEERQQNLDTRLFEDRFPPRKLRFLEFRNLDVARRTRAHLGDRVQSVVTEIQVFGFGYPPLLTLTSDIIDLQAPRNLTTIEWEADEPPGTRVEIRTRSGDELREVKHFFKSDGNEVATQEEYDELPSFFKGEIVTEILPGRGWSDWSQVYLQPGEGIRSPSPRRYMMIQAQLRSDDPEAAARLRSISVHFTEPVAEEVVGEILPKRGVRPGEETSFSLFVRPRFARASAGFDRLRLIAPSGVQLELQGLGLGDEEDFLQRAAETFSRTGEDLLQSAAGEVVQLQSPAPDTAIVQLPRLLRRGAATLVRLDFRARVFQSGSTFAVEIGNSSRPDVWQKVDPGEAVGDALGEGEGLTVMMPVAGSNIRQLRVLPGLFTPNGDGANDEVVFEFAVLKINAQRRVNVDLYDLAGRRRRHLEEVRPQASGLYRIAWDGRDERGLLLPPGLYLAAIYVDSDEGRRNRARALVGLAY